MKTARYAALVTVMLCAVVVARKEEVFESDAVTPGTPVAKVLSMLADMQQKGLHEFQTEEIMFANFTQWCKEKAEHKGNEISEGSDKVEKLQAEIEQAETVEAGFQKDIEQLQAKISKWDAEREAAIKARKEEAAEYQASAADLSESLQNLNNALLVLKEQDDKKVVSESLLQVKMQKSTPAHQKQVLASFLQESSDSQEPGDRYAYESESSGVIDMLKKMREGFTEQFRNLEQQEMKAKSVHQLVLQQLDHQNRTAYEEVDEKNSDMAETRSERKETEDDLKEAQAELAEDKKYLEDMQAMCKIKSENYAKRMAVRKKENNAIGTAIEVLKRKVVGFLQVKQTVASSLAFLGRGNLRSQTRERRAFLVDFLKQRSSQLQSMTLSMLSERAEADPFEEIKKMISNLVFKLEEEQRHETEKKAFCDKELSETNATREKKSAIVDKLKLQLEDLGAIEKQLGLEIKELKTSLAELDVEVEQATKDRNASKVANLQTIQEAGSSQEGCDEAIVALREFYGNNPDFASTALVQVEESLDTTESQSPDADAPSTFATGEYSGMGQGGVIEILEVAESQYATLKAETQDSERMEQGQYESFMEDAEKEKLLKTNELGHKVERKARKVAAFKEKNQDLGEVLGELQKADSYYEKLLPGCSSKPVTYEERAQKSKDEIAALEDALKILQEDGSE